MNQPPSETKVPPPEDPPKADPDERPDGNNATIDHPDPEADRHRVRPDRKEPGPYVTGNY